MPLNEHVENVLRDGAHFEERRELSTAGWLYATSVTSWLDSEDERWIDADAMKKRWDAGESITQAELDRLRSYIESFRPQA